MERTMENALRTAHDFAYPIVENDIADDPTPKSEAIYIPSVSAPYARDAVCGTAKRAIPDHLPKNVLNFLEDNETGFRISHAMTSYGQYRTQRGRNMFTERDRSRTRIIGDSGGYQIATGKFTVDDTAGREQVLRWLENNCDLAMTLDVPTAAIANPDSQYKSFESCLDTTCVHLEYFEKNRDHSKKTLFLNVIQGNKPSECLHWWKTVRSYNFNGWAIAGALRHDIYFLTRLLLEMHEADDLQQARWIHVLGTADLGTAVMLTALQRAITQHLGLQIRFSFDTSTPFRMLAGNQVFGLPRLSTSDMRVEQLRAPAGFRYHGKRLMWPWSSWLGDRMYMSDVIVPCSGENSTQRDTLGNHLLALHNLQALCFAVRNANRVFDVQLVMGVEGSEDGMVGQKQMQAISAIDKIFANPKLSTLEAHVSAFNGLRLTYPPDKAEQERDF
jgi:hypothetical protein